MRNGNSYYSYLSYFSYLSSYPTYEEWKHGLSQALKEDIEMSSYPTYEEWKHTSFISNIKFVSERVLILPMRNGNYLFQLYFLRYLRCSYPTYEEWKPGNLVIFYHSSH